MILLEQIILIVLVWKLLSKYEQGMIFKGHFSFSCPAEAKHTYLNYYLPS